MYIFNIWYPDGSMHLFKGFFLNQSRYAYVSCTLLSLFWKCILSYFNHFVTLCLTLNYFLYFTISSLFNDDFKGFSTFLLYYLLTTYGHYMLEKLLRVPENFRLKFTAPFVRQELMERIILSGSWQPSVFGKKSSVIKRIDANMCKG